ncbi:short-chain fatty acid transporter [Brevibacterium luteolum]|uniref:short-chain fatty acid transporter n=1 Tax=Brevibacterium luteolum TaxID=199591 RepID=UPI001C21DC54|nr:TIGR00366 family protein [Brevibacterium luteolum]MBU8579356.1 TIGR00366 family protein [Brevibacterium luteolum]
MNIIARPFVYLVERFFPESFVFAIVLSVVVFFACIGMTDAGPVETMQAWGDGLAGLLAFMAQIALTVLCAHALAHTGPVSAGLSRLGRLPRNAWQAYALVTLVAGVASLFAWAFGLVVGALLARQVAIEAKARGLRLHYPLLVASAYAGFVLWHMGYSGSAPLFVATPGNEMEETIGGLIPVTETIFAPWNIATAVIGLIVVVTLMPLMRPKDGRDEIIEMSEDAVTDYRNEQERLERELAENLGQAGEVPDASGTGVRTRPTVAQRLDGTRLLVLIPGLGLLAYLVHYFATNGLSLTLDIVNWSFLCLGLLFSRSILHYIKLIANASGSVGQLLVQYPFYAGIMGMMAGTGFISVVSDWFTSISTASTLGFWAFLSAGLLNLFVPSGGGQWAIQGPIFIEAAQNLGTDPSRIVMGVAYGDQWTNMAQPFFAVPLLAVAGIHVRKIMGYTIMVLIVMFFIFGGGILLAGAG